MGEYSSRGGPQFEAMLAGCRQSQRRKKAIEIGQRSSADERDRAAGSFVERVEQTRERPTQLDVVRLVGQIDRNAMNANVVTSTFLERAKVPMVLRNDEEALQTAVRCNWGVPPEETRFVRIPNTLHLEHLYVSENLVEEALANSDAEVVSGPQELRFDVEGRLERF